MVQETSGGKIRARYRAHGPTSQRLLVLDLSRANTVYVVTLTRNTAQGRHNGRMSSVPPPQRTQSVILFDGVCNLCNGAVTFIIDRDPEGHFAFAPLQSEVALELLGKQAESLESIVLVENGVRYTESTAALRIARNLRGPWPLLYSFIVVPRALRDRVYRLVARNRYRWFGKRDSCRLPTPELRQRFL